MNYDLDRFVKAQAYDYDAALREIRSGRKRSHWMWYIFPQLQGLGFSSTAQYYGIRDLEEAKAYMAHPVLGPRLTEISEALLGLDTCDPSAVMGYPDDLKLRSCMTLFEQAAPEQPVFGRVLEKYYAGRRDGRTLELLKRA
ncbi:MAG: DUF1810 domain-containing protein [Oscillospiraceae bacterium]|nr:DUF1810 domain-containing protein [Oscillospiraceae bacterium]